MECIQLLAMSVLTSQSNDEVSGIKTTIADRKRRRESSVSNTSLKPTNNKPKLSNGRCPSVGERYEKIGRVGEGTYGIVYKARDKHTNQLVALKRCLPHQEATEGFPITTLREIAMLWSSQHHPNIIQLQTVLAVSSSAVFLVFDYCPHDLAQLVDQHYQIHRKSPFSLPQVKRLLLQLFSALEFIHARNILHRDLKLANLLYDGELKLADFGLSRKYKVPLTPKVMSLWYRPPELLLGASRYNESIDIWGAGCVMGELLLGKPLWTCKTEMEMIRTLFNELGTPHEAIRPGILELPLIANETIELPTIYYTCKTVGSLSRNITSRSHVILQFNEVGSH